MTSKSPVGNIRVVTLIRTDLALSGSVLTCVGAPTQVQDKVSRGIEMSPDSLITRCAVASTRPAQMRTERITRPNRRMSEGIASRSAVACDVPERARGTLAEGTFRACLTGLACPCWTTCSARIRRIPRDDPQPHRTDKGPTHEVA